MPEVRLERTLRVPADPAAQALGELLQAISANEGPWRGFALHIGLGDLHLPDVGYVAVPIDLTVAKHPTQPRTYQITFQASLLPAAFPTFKGTFGVEPAGLGESTLTLDGGYDVPMQIFGNLLDRAVAPGIAHRTLENFIEEIAAACTARVDEREAEFVRYRFFARSPL